MQFDWSNHRNLVVAGVALLIAALLTLVILTPGGDAENLVVPIASSGSETGSEPALGGEIRVEISGAVVSPAVVRLAEGSRLVDAIEAAGGWGERVDPLRVEICLNLAAPLQDGSAIRIPTLDDRFLLGVSGVDCGPLYAPPTEVATAAGASGTTKTSAPVNLNTATEAELDALPGIGPVTAAKIVAARKQGIFLVADDLVSRGIISSRVLEQIRPLVTP